MELGAPSALERLLHLRGQRTLLRGLGVRELVSAAGIFGQRQPTLGVWSRVAGDIMDLALLAAALGKNRVQRSRVAGAAGVILAIGAVDLACAQQLSRQARRA